MVEAGDSYLKLLPTCIIEIYNIMFEHIADMLSMGIR